MVFKDSNIYKYVDVSGFEAFRMWRCDIIYKWSDVSWYELTVSRMPFFRICKTSKNTRIFSKYMEN